MNIFVNSISVSVHIDRFKRTWIGSQFIYIQRHMHYLMPYLDHCIVIEKFNKCFCCFALFAGKNPREGGVWWSWRWGGELIGSGIEACTAWPVLARSNTSHCHAVQHQWGHDPCVPGFHTGNDGMAVTADASMSHFEFQPYSVYWEWFVG